LAISNEKVLAAIKMLPRILVKHFLVFRILRQVFVKSVIICILTKNFDGKYRFTATLAKPPQPALLTHSRTRSLLPYNKDKEFTDVLLRNKLLDGGMK
jgi:hypothetical protein